MFDCDFSGNNYCPGNYIDFEVNHNVAEEWRKKHLVMGLVSVQNLGSHNYTLDAKPVRGDFQDFLNSAAGSVPSQYNMVNSTTNPFNM